ncbi:GDSL-type esterase/lipase family protein [Acidobacteria bacterium AH-259-G07]|nr:GDSL-type esterase/lipase family protein [Acidobacteria bacterium AH-259-G07]
MRTVSVVVLACVFLFAASCLNRQPTLTLEPGDHVVIIGNTLAERMQYFGHFETFLHARYPEHQLVVRNLGFSADEVAFRPRLLNFGSPDHHLEMWKADVVIAFFGFNESFRGEDGLQKFRAELEEFIKHTRSQKYNGNSPPRLAIVSPIAHEDLGNPNYPDGSKNNANLRLYTRVMAQVARKHGVPFADLFTPTLRMMRDSSHPLTINGVHLSDFGYSKLAPILDEALFGPPQGQGLISEQLQAEVNQKNLFFFHRYRAVNGYYIYGGRSRRDHGNPPFTDAYVLENERGKLDDMVANRDQRVWRVAQGLFVPAEIDDSNTRPLYQVPTNFHQPIRILPPEEARKKFKVAKGYAVNLFAAEEEFPELKNPVQMTFDARGRLWILTMPDYPMFLPPNKPNDKLLILEDVDRDGRADELTVFADGLHVPTGFELGDGGVYVAQQPNLMFLKDVDGDDKADERNFILHGFDSGDSHHAISAFNWGPGGGLYMHEGTFHHTSVETPYGVVRNAHGGVYRYEPKTGKFETFIHYNFANPWGHVFDRWGQNFVADASGGNNYFAAAFSGKAPQFTGQPDFGPFKFAYRAPLKQFIVKRVRPTAGCEIVSSRHFPPEAQGNFLLNNVIGFRGVLQHVMKDIGSGIAGTEIEPLLFSSDRNFRPTDLQFGPDGALYLVDWFNPLVGHMQHNLRDPNRDHSHGRIWRITYPSRPLLEPPQIAGQPIPVLLDLLKTYEDRTRHRVRLELRQRDTAEVLRELEKWISTLDESDEEYEHHLLEALWVHQHHNAANKELLKRVLSSPDFRGRAAATRVLSFWRDEIKDPLSLLRTQAADKHPRVRLEAVRACSFFEEVGAAEIALEILKQPLDDYLDYTLNETMRTLEPYWKPVVVSGHTFAGGNPAGTEFLLDRLGLTELTQMARSRPVYLALLSRPGIDSTFRLEAASSLARLNNTTEATELVEAVRRLDRSDEEESEPALRDLVGILTELPGVQSLRTELEDLSVSATRSITRQLAYATLVSAGQRPNELWARALRSPQALLDLVESVPLIQEADARNLFHPYVKRLLRELPEFRDQNVSSKGSLVQSIRLSAIRALASLPGREIESYRTLAPFLKDRRYREVAVSALGRLPKSGIPEGEVVPMVRSLLEYVASVPAKNRTSGVAAEATRLADDLTGLLPVDRAKPLRDELADLRVRVIVIRPVPNRMRYNRKEFYVQAGKPVEIVFENTDIMPHNLIVTLPGALVDVGMAAEEMASRADAFAKHFIPDTPKVLYASRLLQPGEKDKIQFTAPKKRDDYPYVCTFPGHWQTMFGAMHVVASLENIPAEELESAPPETTSRDFVRDWKLQDLTASLAGLDKDRAFDHGEQLFTALSCAKCHQMNGQGGSIGPDLTLVRDKLASGELDRVGLLTEFIEPSKLIEPKYRTEIVTTKNGLLISGIVSSEDDQRVRFLPNPLESDQPVEVQKDLVERRWQSDISLMPQGLLNTLTEKEILDLLAYVASAGGLKSKNNSERAGRGPTP